MQPKLLVQEARDSGHQRVDPVAKGAPKIALAELYLLHGMPCT
jgi:hypothetical protein